MIAMLDDIQSIVEYVQNNNTSLLSEKLEQQFGKTALRVMLINLVSWVKRKKTFGSKKPLTLSIEINWQRNLLTLIENNYELQKIFNVREHQLDFNEEMGERAMQDIVDYVAENYNPPLRT